MRQRKCLPFHAPHVYFTTWYKKLEQAPPCRLCTCSNFLHAPPCSLRALLLLPSAALPPSVPLLERPCCLLKTRAGIGKPLCLGDYKICTHVYIYIHTYSIFIFHPFVPRNMCKGQLKHRQQNHNSEKGYRSILPVSRPFL